MISPAFFTVFAGKYIEAVNGAFFYGLSHRHKSIVAVVEIHGNTETHLFEIADTFDCLSGGTGFAQCWQQHTGEDGYNSDDHGYCYEGKRRVFLMQ